MRLHRFIGDFNFSKSTCKLLDKELCSQIKNVLRLKRGEEVLLCDGKGSEVRARIEEIQKNSITVVIQERIEVVRQSMREVTLYCALLKRENFEWVAQKGTEVGIAKLVPLTTDHTVKLNINADRIKKIMKEASEQCGRRVVPELGDTQHFSSLLKELTKECDAVLVCDSSGKPFQSLNIEKKSRVALCIGPEGGWSEREYAIIKQTPKIVCVSLGTLTLRAETATLIASYLTVNVA